MFELKTELVNRGNCTCHKLLRSGTPMDFESVLDALCEESEFREFFSKALEASEYSAFRWETPALTLSSIKSTFEFVLVNAEAFSLRRTDEQTFAAKFEDSEDGHVVVFDNLRGDASLIVPCPNSENDVYGHLASFVRGAPNSQLHSFWKTVGETVKQKLGDQSIWLNTAGGGVAWLHVRIDSTPKYYSYAPYRKLKTEFE